MRRLLRPRSYLSKVVFSDEERFSPAKKWGQQSKSGAAKTMIGPSKNGLAKMIGKHPIISCKNESVF